MLAQLKQCLAFRCFETEEDRRMARTLLSIILFFWALGLLALFINQLSWQNELLTEILIVGNTLQIFPFVMLLKKKFTLVSFFLTSLYTLATVSIATIGGGLHDYIAMLFPITIIFAGLTAQQRGLIFSTLLTLAGIAWLFFGERLGWFQATASYAPEWADLLIATILVLALAWMVYWLITNNQFGLAQTWRELDERKRLEIELRKLTQAVEQSPVSIMITNLDGMIEYVNPHFTEVTGYRSDEVIGKSPGILKSRRTPPGAYRQVWENIQAGKEWHGEFRNRKKDGTEYYESAVITPIIGKNGLPTHYLSIQEDVTERVQAQQALQESETRYRRLIEGLPAIIYTFSTKRGGLFHSPYVEQVLGYSSAELRANPFLWGDSIHPEDKPKVDGVVASFESCQSFNFEYRIRTKSGEWRWLMDRSIGRKVENDEVLIEGLATDITDRKQAEQLLQESNAWQHALFEHARDAIFLADPETGQILDANSQAESLFGIPRMSLITKHQSELHPPSIKNLVSRQFYEHAKGTDKLFDAEILTSDDRIIPVEINASLVSLPNRKPVLQGIFRDITGRKRNQSTLQTRMEILELAAHQSLEDFMQTALDKIAAITGSEVGFYHFVSEDQKKMSLQAWSTRTLQEFCKVEGKGLHYAVDEAGIWADCIRQGRPVIHNDYQSTPEKKGLPPGHARVIRELVVPIYREGRVVSILGVGNKPTNYLEEDTQTVSYLADVIWEIVQRKRVEQSLNEIESRLHLLSQNLNDAGLYVYTHDTQGKPNFEYLSPGMESLIGVKTQEVLRDAAKLHATICPEFLPALAGLEAQSKQSLQPFEIEIRQRHAISGELRWMLLRSTPRRRVDGSTVWYGVQIDVTERKLNEQLIEDANQRLLAQMSEIEKLQDTLREQAIHDSLTELYNRRYLKESLQMEINRARRTQQPFCVVILDLDDLKTINDRHGHITGGDLALQTLAAMLKKMCRESDTICRYGGDEFMILMYGAPAPTALRRANEWLEEARKIKLGSESGEFTITFSAGLAEYQASDADGESILIRADRALYRAKENGKNRVECYIEDMDSDIVTPNSFRSLNMP